MCVCMCDSQTSLIFLSLSRLALSLAFCVHCAPAIINSTLISLAFSYNLSRRPFIVRIYYRHLSTWLCVCLKKKCLHFPPPPSTFHRCLLASAKQSRRKAITIECVCGERRKTTVENSVKFIYFAISEFCHAKQLISIWCWEAREN